MTKTWTPTITALTEQLEEMLGQQVKIEFFQVPDQELTVMKLGTLTSTTRRIDDLTIARTSPEKVTDLLKFYMEADLLNLADQLESLAVLIRKGLG
jgi:hypothetical protein